MEKLNNLLCSCVLVLVCSVHSQLAQSPCPGVFDYYRDEYGIYGRMVIKPGTPTAKLVVQINFTVTARITSNYYGRLDQENESHALQNYNRGTPMVFRVNLPISSPLPKVTAITVNGRLICSGPGDNLRPNRYLTTFSLQHSSFFNGPVHIPVNKWPVIDNTDEYPDENIPVYTTSQRPVYTNNRNPPRRTTTTTEEPVYYMPEEEVNNIPDPVAQRQPVTQGFSNPQCGTRASDDQVTPLIYGGDDYQRGDQPWLVALYKKSGSDLNFNCGGTLVSDRHVISAGHCVWIERASIELILVKLGVHRLSDWEDKNVVGRSLVDAKIHENYDPSTFKNDISILILKTKVTFNNYIRPACLWQGDIDIGLIAGSSGVVAGWGKQNKQGGGADIPKIVSLPIVKTEKCRASKPSFINFTSDKTFCGGDRSGRGPCSGDSGGGFYVLDGVRWMLRGVVSVSLRGPDGMCNLNEYLIFTDIAQYLPWIYKILSTNYFD